MTIKHTSDDCLYNVVQSKIKCVTIEFTLRGAKQVKAVYWLSTGVNSSSVQGL